jgi:hypothetical protein
VTANIQQGECAFYSGTNHPWYNPAAPAPSPWSKRKPITVTCAPVSGFPMLSVTDLDIKASAKADGYDILFTNADGAKLDHQIERYNAATGEPVAWVR